MSDQLEQLFSQWEAGHQAATTKPTRDELDAEFRAWFADAAESRRPGLSINETVARQRNAADAKLVSSADSAARMDY